MKKIISILILFVSCYFIYNLTIDNEIYYLTLGDGLAKGINSDGKISLLNYSKNIQEYLEEKNKLEGFNNSFVDKDYRITDILKIIKYKEVITVDNNEMSIHELLKKADVITISVGMNELYYKLKVDNNNIYQYIEGMLNDMDNLLKEVDRYNHKKVIVLGYYNTTNTNKDIFNYINYKLEKIVINRGFDYINLDKSFDNDVRYFENNNNFYPNDLGYSKISQIIVEKIKNYWYNITRIYISMTFVMAEGEKKWKQIFIQIMLKLL